MKLFNQVIKNHALDLIEFYGIILIMVVPFMLWLLPKWSPEVRILYLCVLQVSIFMGLLTRFTTDLTIFNTNVQYCLAPIKPRGKILAPLLFFLLNFLIAEVLVLFFVNLTHTFSLGSITLGLGQIFLLYCYILIIVILGMLLSFTLLPKPQIIIPALTQYKVNPQQILSSAGTALYVVIGLASLILPQAVGKILYTPFFNVTLRAGDYIPASTRAITINTLPYLILGLGYILLIFFLKDRAVYLE